ncbi:putative ribosomal RNA methyltransferase [Gottschalkia acidurici 9a]|uniref:Ribosomal RNA methyltransferase n=1 Tax=Gottschalkia acidurici (strain ATCC 7906 / DSM 604 / BCRC 14475 / CIP 104303 / KCTC 5404 / NCIMB 10678 / 9a) TaxID=1128398 RepID=K0AX91_GOTA9|nr:TlyA family RNA methyltransferase [Gottschalkia acidurici]AFS78398.1 putative ribosomal RNA methyltransferase [Gottschalkia acidurici 9a]
MKKERIDVLLVEKGLAESREKAKRFIMAGIVFVDNEKIDKSGTKVSVESDILVKGNPLPYVSRGGLKLEKALKEFPISVEDKVALDIGASTGGFTDCMLKNGAKKVYAIDVGYGQLAWEIRSNEKVIPMDRTNIRYVKKEDIGELSDFVSIDVSFISLKLILPVVKELTKEDVEVIALIKPQFEAGREKVGKKGVVKDKKVHQEVIEQINSFCESIGLYINDLTYSPIKGAEGNREYLAYITKREPNRDIVELINTVVNESHDEL